MQEEVRLPKKKKPTPEPEPEEEEEPMEEEPVKPKSPSPEKLPPREVALPSAFCLSLITPCTYSRLDILSLSSHAVVFCARRRVPRRRRPVPRSLCQ